LKYASNNNSDFRQDSNTSDSDQDDDSADAWGWGGDEAGDAENTTEEEQKIPEGVMAASQERTSDSVREITLKEQYTISSMPDSVYKNIKSIVEDGATLTQEM
jgi:protein transport protein DSL1/ZW10